jgi:hypothetical protein
LFEIEDLLLDILALKQLQYRVLDVVADQFILGIVKHRLYDIAAKHATFEELFPGHTALSHILGIIHL